MPNMLKEPWKARQGLLGPTFEYERHVEWEYPVIARYFHRDHYCLSWGTVVQHPSKMYLAYHGDMDLISLLVHPLFFSALIVSVWRLETSRTRWRTDSLPHPNRAQQQQTMSMLTNFRSRTRKATAAIIEAVIGKHLCTAQSTSPHLLVCIHSG